MKEKYPYVFALLMLLKEKLDEAMNGGVCKNR